MKKEKIKSFSTAWSRIQIAIADSLAEEILTSSEKIKLPIHIGEKVSYASMGTKDLYSLPWRTCQCPFSNSDLSTES